MQKIAVNLAINTCHGSPWVCIFSSNLAGKRPARLVRFAGHIEMRFTGHFGETMQGGQVMSRNANKIESIEQIKKRRTLE